MDHRYLNPSMDTTRNYTEDQNYEQPATHAAAYPQPEGYGDYQNQPGGYDDQYQYPEQNPGQQAYQEGEYQAESTEPSLSDYNSHESCIRITTKK